MFEVFKEIVSRYSSGGLLQKHGVFTDHAHSFFSLILKI